MHYTFRTLVAAFALAGLGCEWIPPVVDPELVALERALKLEIAHVDRLQNGAAEFTFTLSNHGTSVADACLGPGRSVSYESAHSSGTALTLVDHPGCMKPFTIHPGGEMRWREEVQLSSAAKGSVDVQVDLQIVNPRRCAWTGCSAMDVHSNRYSIP